MIPANEDETVVDYRRDGEDIHHLVMNSRALPEIRINYTGIPMDERGGTAVRLLCASMLYCFAATLASALSARGASIKAMTGRATGIRAKDEVRRTKVTEVNIAIDVDLDDKDVPILEKCKKIMKHGCLVTYSVEDAIEVEYDIQRVGR